MWYNWFLWYVDYMVFNHEVYIKLAIVSSATVERQRAQRIVVVDRKPFIHGGNPTAVAQRLMFTPLSHCCPH